MRENICTSLNKSYNCIAKKKKNEHSDFKMGRGSAYTFLKRRHTNGQRYMKRCSASLSSGKCKSKLTSVRMDVLKKTRDEFG